MPVRWRISCSRTTSPSCQRRLFQAVTPGQGERRGQAAGRADAEAAAQRHGRFQKHLDRLGSQIADHAAHGRKVDGLAVQTHRDVRPPAAGPLPSRHARCKCRCRATRYRPATCPRWEGKSPSRCRAKRRADSESSSCHGPELERSEEMRVGQAFEPDSQPGKADLRHFVRTLLGIITSRFNHGKHGRHG